MQINRLDRECLNERTCLCQIVPRFGQQIGSLCNILPFHYFCNESSGLNQVRISYIDISTIDRPDRQLFSGLFVSYSKWKDCRDCISVLNFCSQIKNILAELNILGCCAVIAIQIVQVLRAIIHPDSEISAKGTPNKFV